MEKRFLLQLAYCVALLLANWFDPRLISFGNAVVDAGTLIFPFTYISADILTEVYGYKYSRITIWLGFIVNLFFLLYGQLIAILPSPAFAVATNHAFDQFFQMDLRVIVASFISYFCAEPLNAMLIAKLKIKFRGQYMAARFLGSTIIASAVDTVLFSLIAFYGVIPQARLTGFILTLWSAKIIIELTVLPFSTKLSKRLKHSEQIDRYDVNTRFTLFSWETRYEKNH